MAKGSRRYGWQEGTTQGTTDPSDTDVQLCAEQAGPRSHRRLLPGAGRSQRADRRHRLGRRSAPDGRQGLPRGRRQGDLFATDHPAPEEAGPGEDQPAGRTPIAANKMNADPTQARPRRKRSEELHSSAIQKGHRPRQAVCPIRERIAAEN